MPLDRRTIGSDHLSASVISNSRPLASCPPTWRGLFLAHDRTRRQHGCCALGVLLWRRQQA